MKTYQIHLLRHGITDGNVKGQYIGSKDIPLNDTGISHIRSLDENYIYPDVRPVDIDEFRECDFGDFEGLTAGELSDDKYFAEWLASDGSCAPPGGESGVEFGRRVCQAFEKIVEALMKTGIPSALIMTHAGVIMTILTQYGLPEASMSEWTMEPGCGYSVRIHPQLWTAARKVEVYQTIPLAREDEDEYDAEYLIADAPERSEDAEK